MTRFATSTALLGTVCYAAAALGAIGDSSVQAVTVVSSIGLTLVGLAVLSLLWE